MIRAYLIGLLTLLLACHEKTAIPKQTEFSIGWIGPKSGPASIIGVDSLRAVEMALEEFREKYPNIPFSFYSEDDQYLSRNSIVKYESLVADHHLNLLILATYSAVETISKLAITDQVIVIDPIDNDQRIARSQENTFFIAKNTENLADLIVNQIVKEARKKTLIMHYKDDDFMPVLAVRVDDELKRQGVSTEKLSYDRKTVNFRPMLQKAKTFGADSFVFLGYEEIGLAIKIARKMGFKKEPIFAANMGNLVVNAAGSYADKVYFTDFSEQDSPSLEIHSFLARFKKRFNKKPDLLWTAVQSYDASRLALQAFVDASPKDSHEFAKHLRSHLKDVKNYEGLSGRISILPSGASQGILWSLYQWSGMRPAQRVLRLDLP